MKIGLLLPTYGGSPLVVGLERGLPQLGHQIEYVQHDAAVYDLVLLFNISAHTKAYEYLRFPQHTPFAFIDTAEYGYWNRLPERQRLFANSFTESAMGHDTKNSVQQARLKRFLEGRSFPYFLRETFKGIQYPSGYHPIDYPLYSDSACNRRPNLGDYRHRALDLYCCWGASHPFRMNITDALRRQGCRSHIYVLEVDGPRRPQNEYFAMMEGSRCTVSYDGYGSGSFRMTEALVRTVLLQGPLSIVTRAPLVDGETCVMYDVVNDGEQFVSTNIRDKLVEVLSNPERSFRIYEQGYDWCQTHLTERATAAYILDVCAAHDWSKPTELNV